MLPLSLSMLQLGCHQCSPRLLLVLLPVQAAYRKRRKSQGLSYNVNQGGWTAELTLKRFLSFQLASRLEARTGQAEASCLTSDLAAYTYQNQSHRWKTPATLHATSTISCPAYRSPGVEAHAFNT